MDEHYRNQVALFRYGIIAPLVTSGETTPAERGKFFRNAAEKDYSFVDGRIVSVSDYTVSRYYKAYMTGGFDALKPKGRSDVGKIRKLDEDSVSQIEYLHKEYPRMPSTLIYQKLIENGTISKSQVSLSTITRYVSSLKKKEGTMPGREFRRYELEHINEVWYGDSSVGPYLRDGKKRLKTWMIALIDDASRFVVGIDIFFNDNYINLMQVIRSAVQKYGKPQTLKFDNGANYRSHQMELLCARLGTALSYAPPKSPQSKAKCERLFRTIKDHWMSQLNMADFHNIDELRESLFTYIQKYNQTVHSSLDGKTPQQRFFDESNLIVRLSDEKIENSFLLELERRVSRDGIITIDNQEFEVDYKYSSQKLTIRYSPDFSHLYTVDPITGELDEIHILNKLSNSDSHRHTQHSYAASTEDTK